MNDIFQLRSPVAPMFILTNSNHAVNQEKNWEMTMNAKLIIAAAALSVSMGSAFTISPAMAKEPGICVFARSALTRGSPAAPGLVRQCAALGGNAYGLPPVELGRVIPQKFQKDSASAVINHPLPIGTPAPAPVPVSTPPAPVPASQPSGPVIDVNVGGGYDNGNNDGISCDEGRSIVRQSGFRKVHVMDCSSDVFTYSAKKHDQRFEVFVSSDGDIVHVSNLSF